MGNQEQKKPESNQNSSNPLLSVQTSPPATQNRNFELNTDGRIKENK